MIEKVILPPDVIEAVNQIIERGNVAEIKREHDLIVVVEIERKVRKKVVCEPKYEYS